MEQAVLNNIISEIPDTSNNYGALNRDNVTGTGLILTDVSQIINFGAQYPIQNGFPVLPDLFSNNITVLEDGHYAIHFSTQILGAAERTVIFHLNINGVPFDLKQIPKGINTPNHFSMFEVRPLLTNNTITISSYYDNSTGSGTDITIDHPTLLVIKLI